MNEKNTITVKDENGKEVVCDILFTFDNEETKKSYIVYTDNTKDENGHVRVYASTYDPNDPKMKLNDIETEREWKIIEAVISTIQEDLAGIVIAAESPLAAR